MTARKGKENAAADGQEARDADYGSREKQFDDHCQKPGDVYKEYP
jgi:hypothetical protein